ncbi:acyl-CoA thioesterase [Alteromonas facilis]|uniref:acyl-CoA thioesterase n=1 Tax=Alteromonas facilis TaxID=2048004 RepID=UPI000C283524|nr:acyl-CoA thioesterase [Alteromonas facilis]
MQADVLLRVRFADCDPQNVVFNARYADYVDVASTEYLRGLCGGYDKLEAQGFATQVVNLNIDWHSSAQFDDVLLLSMQCEHIGNSSFTLMCSMMRHEDSTPIATARVVYVFMDSTATTKCNVPDWMRAALSQKKVHGPVNMAGL